MERIIRVNTHTGEIATTPVPERMARLGGRGLIADIMVDEVSPICHPLGRGNKLIFAPGLLGGTPVPASGRLSIGGKSPLTGGIKESNVGGEAGQKLARIGVRALILEDAPDEPTARILYLNKDRVEWIDDDPIAGRSVQDSLTLLHKRFGPSCGLLVIGPAGEMKMAAAGIATTGPESVQTRYAARGGLGAVMGAKGVKGIVIDDRGTTNYPGYDQARFKESYRTYTQMLLASPKLEARRRYGTAGIVVTANELGLLPTRNFSRGSCDGIDEISGERLAETIAARGGEGRSGVACMTGCVIKCSNVYPDQTGKKKVATLQYENIALLGSNCGITNLDGIAELNALCNDIGLDAIEIGGVLGVAMEAGLIRFGDVDGAADLLRRIGEGEPLGRILGEGVAFTGRALGSRRIPAVNGQGIPGYDPRGLKGNGVTYVTSPMGADHTAGNAFGTAKTLDPLSKEGQVENSRKLQIRAVILDTFGLCLFARGPFVERPGLLVELIFGRFGWDLAFADITQAAAETLRLERGFNDAAGSSDRSCDVPEFMRYEPLPPHNTVYDITPEETAKIWEIEPDRDEF